MRVWHTGWLAAEGYLAHNRQLENAALGCMY